MDIQDKTSETVDNGATPPTEAQLEQARLAQLATAAEQLKADILKAEQEASDRATAGSAPFFLSVVDGITEANPETDVHHLHVVDGDVIGNLILSGPKGSLKVGEHYVVRFSHYSPPASSKS